MNAPPPILDLAGFDVVAGDAVASDARAIIDIGSNTVRLVIYGPPRRSPVVLHNEKVTARLGKGVAENGRISDKAITQALTALARFSTLLRLRGVVDVQTVATAAVRDAGNGANFLRAVAGLGLSPRLLSGEEEAEASARGVAAAFPGASGVVGDLGGGSLELVTIAGAASAHATSLPLGTLRLPALRAGGGAKFARRVRKMLEAADWRGEQGRTFYLVGGSWRAFGRYAMLRRKWPVDDPHGFSLTAEEALRTARRLRESGLAAHHGDAAALAASSGQAAKMPVKAAIRPKGKPAPVAALHPLAGAMQVSASRLTSLPDAAALLEVLVRELKPARLVFSSWGLREGLLAASCDATVTLEDPLLAGITAFVEQHGEGLAEAAAEVARWTAHANPGEGGGREGLRRAAIMLALASMRSEPNLRGEVAAKWALRKRWIGISDGGRAMLAMAVLANNGRTAIPRDLLRIASPAGLREGLAWGLATRLARRFCGASAEAMAQSALAIEGSVLVLTVEPAIAALCSELVEKDLRLLAECLGLGWDMRRLRKPSLAS